MDSKYPAQAKTMSERQSGNQTGTTIQEGERNREHSGTKTESSHHRKGRGDPETEQLRAKLLALAPGVPEIFDRLDRKHGDGGIALHDFRLAIKDLDIGDGVDGPKPHIDTLFALIDTKGDDVITLDELEAFLEGRAAV